VPRFVALLRGVNVGKGNRVPMPEFKATLEALGYTSVSTLLNSGNAVFTGAGTGAVRHAARICAALAARLAVTTPTVVKSATELGVIVDRAPMRPAAPEHSRFLVVFAQDAATLRALRELLPLVRPPEKLVVAAHAAYLYCPQGSLASKAGAALLGKTRGGITTRNWATVLKLHALAGDRVP
jgi:uncharacterized protein (DUF1697 family)